MDVQRGDQDPCGAFTFRRVEPGSNLHGEPIPTALDNPGHLIAQVEGYAVSQVYVIVQVTAVHRYYGVAGEDARLFRR